MIEILSIKNFTIIQNLEINFSKGLNIITGETGAGKSILLGALGLLMGRRVDGNIHHNSEKKCILEAIFKNDTIEVKQFLNDLEIDIEEQIIIRREISPNGKTRSFINDTPSPLKSLQQLTSMLIDLHQQFDHAQLQNKHTQMDWVDAFAGTLDLRSEFAKDYAEFVSIKKQHYELNQKIKEKKAEWDYIQFQLAEFEELGIQAGEERLLENEEKTLIHAEEIKKESGQAAFAINESEQNLVQKVRDISLILSRIEEFHPKINDAISTLLEAEHNLDEVSNILNQISTQVEYDPARMEEIRSRLDSIYALQNKHRVNSSEELLKIEEKLCDETLMLTTMEKELEKLSELSLNLKKDITIKADKLSEERRNSTPIFEKQIKKLLTELVMENARIKINMNNLPDLQKWGKDEIQFLFSANPGSPLLPLQKVASGGELSRVNLSLKSIIAKKLVMPTMIFDEIDTGISGDVAIKMGSMMSSLSANHQVISITHSPQVAAKAHKHFFIYKISKADSTETKMKVLEGKERVEKLAVMLSTNPPTKSAIKNAKELISMVG